jgi:uncharacterized protein YjbJ (UPF0337 family)
LESHRGQLEGIQGQGQAGLGQIDRDELDKISGKREELEGKIQKRYGVNKDLAKQDVDEWLKKLQ